MRRFAFRLSRLERLRDVQRKEARAALVAALAVLRERRRQRELEERIVAEATAAELDGELAADPTALKQLAAWRDGRRRCLKAAEREEAQAQQTVGAAKREHTEAARAHRVLERLHEKGHAQWLHEAESEEQKFLDEVHLLCIARSKGAGSREQKPGIASR